VESLGLITGSDKGTYYQFGLNLPALVKPQGIDLTVYPSRGSVENIYAVFQRPGIQMGIVQADVQWKAADLNFPLTGWDQYDCVAKYVRKAGRPATATKPSSPNPVLDAIKGMLGN